MLNPQPITLTSGPSKRARSNYSSQVFQFRECFLSPLIIFLSLGTALEGEAMSDAELHLLWWEALVRDQRGVTQSHQHDSQSVPGTWYSFLPLA